MLKFRKLFSVLLLFIFCFQSIFMSGASTLIENNVVMDISIPELFLTAFTTTTNSVELVWTSSDNSIKAAAYDVYRNNILIKTVTSFTYTDTGLEAETQYKYVV